MINFFSTRGGFIEFEFAPYRRRSSADVFGIQRAECFSWLSGFKRPRFDFLYSGRSDYLIFTDIRIPAAVGIFLAALCINFYYNPDSSPVDNFAIALIPGTAIYITLLIMNWCNRRIHAISSPGMNYSDIDAFDILSFCIVQSLINTGIHQIFFAIRPEYGVSPGLFETFGMFIGDLSGSFLIFIALNVLFSLARCAVFVFRQTL